jgi:PIN domain nuclease of toxin-antitoxin system
VSPLILLDTHVIWWVDQADAKLGPTAAAAVKGADLDHQLAISAITFLEFGLLQRKGRLEPPRPLAAWRETLLECGLRELPLDGLIAIQANRLEAFHADPADRIIVATALAHAAILVTADEQILAWPGDLVRLDARR